MMGLTCMYKSHRYVLVVEKWIPPRHIFLFDEGLSRSLSPKIDNPCPPRLDKKLNGITELNINAEETISFGRNKPR
jgi:hypothetical protein